MEAANNNYNFLKRSENYNDNINNYKIPYELTVTITLNEYRNLVANSAKKDLEIQNKDIFIGELQDEIKKLNNTLKPIQREG